MVGLRIVTDTLRLLLNLGPSVKGSSNSSPLPWNKGTYHDQIINNKTAPKYSLPIKKGNDLIAIPY